MAKRIVHYLNQFYAGIGGEDMADVTPSTHEKVMGPGMALKAALESKKVADFITSKYDGAVVSTVTNPTDDDIRAFLAGNLYRCSGYEGQLRGIRAYLDSRRQGGNA